MSKQKIFGEMIANLLEYDSFEKPVVTRKKPCNDHTQIVLLAVMEDSTPLVLDSLHE